MDIHICGERRSSMYRQCMNVSEMRREKAETRRRAKEQAWELTRVFHTHIQLGSPQPYSTALLPKRDPPNGPTKKFKNKQKSQQRIISL